MYFLSDFSNNAEFARKLGSKDKKQRQRPSIRSGIATGAKWGAGLGAGLSGISAAATLATPMGRQNLRNVLQEMGRNPSIRKNAGMIAAGTGLAVGANAIAGGIQGGILGGGINAVRKMTYKQDKNK